MSDRALRLLALAPLVAFVALLLGAAQDALPASLRRLYAFPGGDAVGHVVVLAVVAFATRVALPWRVGARVPAVGGWTWGLLGLTVLASLEEVAQRWVPGRTASWLDWAASLLGLALGAFLARQLAARRQKPARMTA